MRFSLFQKSLFFSALLTIFFILATIFPFTRPTATDLSNELRPQILEWFMLIWWMPLGLIATFLFEIGLYPGNENTGLRGGPIIIPFFATLFWAGIFYATVRVARYIQSKIIELKKK